MHILGETFVCGAHSDNGLFVCTCHGGECTIFPVLMEIPTTKRVPLQWSKGMNTRVFLSHTMGEEEATLWFFPESERGLLRNLQKILQRHAIVRGPAFRRKRPREQDQLDDVA